MGSFLYTLVRYDRGSDLAHVRAFFFGELLGYAELALLADPFDLGYAEHMPFEGEGSVEAVVSLHREEVVSADADAPPEVLRELELHRLTHPALLGFHLIGGAQHLYSIAQRSPRPPRFHASPTSGFVAAAVELDEPLAAPHLRSLVLDTSNDHVARALARAGLTALLCPFPVRMYRWDGDHPMLPVPGVELRLDYWLESSMAVRRWGAAASLQAEGRLGRAWLDSDGLHLVPADGLTPDRVLAMYEELRRLGEELYDLGYRRRARAALAAGDVETARRLEDAARACDVWLSGGTLYIRPWSAVLAEELRRLLGAAKVEVAEVRLLPAEQAVFSDEVIAVWRFMRRVEELLS
jgi:hypothetical protein